MGDWLETRSRKQIDPTNLNIEDIDIEDIAHSLSLQCRFNGHCSKFYGVAEHSLRVAGYLFSHCGRHQLALEGLLHDASEYLVGDLPRPLKLQLPNYCNLEHQIQAKIAEKFQLPYPFSPEVKVADNVLLATEARDLMGKHILDLWNLSEKPMDATIYPMTAEIAEVAFLKCFASLTYDDKNSTAVINSKGWFVE